MVPTKRQFLVWITHSSGKQSPSITATPPPTVGAGVHVHVPPPPPPVGGAGAAVAKQVQSFSIPRIACGSPQNNAKAADRAAAIDTACIRTSKSEHHEETDQLWSQRSSRRVYIEQLSDSKLFEYSIEFGILALVDPIDHGPIGSTNELNLLSFHVRL